MKNLLDFKVFKDGFYRAKVPGGWIVRDDVDKSMVFVPDLGHRWLNEDEAPDEVAIVPVAESPGPHLFVFNVPLGITHEAKIDMMSLANDAVQVVYPGSAVLGLVEGISLEKVSVSDLAANGLKIVDVDKQEDKS